MIRYLLDELTTYEKSHDNALCPIQDEVDQSLNGDHVLTQPPKTSELRECVSHMNRQYDELKEQNLQLGRQLASMLSLMTSNMHISPVYPTPSTQQAALSQMHPIPLPTPATSHSHVSNQFFTSTSPISHTFGQIPTPTPLSLPAQPLVWSAIYPSPSHNGFGTLGPSIPKAKIPNLPRGPSGWKEAINQWEKIDPDTGFALKDWPKSWYTGDMKRFNACKRTMRRRIAEEYNR